MKAEARAPRGDLPISHYAIIGDGITAALVAVDGSVDWMCHGRFDGPAVFCRLLDSERGGFQQVAPATGFRSVQRYVGNTNVLATDFECATGRIRLTDCMPLGAPDGPVLLRKLEGLSGTVPVRVDFCPTFDFGREDAVVELVARGCRARAPGASLHLSGPAPMTLVPGGAAASFSMEAGDTRWIVMSHAETRLDDAAADEALRSTLATWERWSAAGHYPASNTDLLRRSALVLKLLIHSPSGAVVAAPTTSLPETPGGIRNWDYRFVWLRDASWVVSALMDLGYHEESMAFIAWLESLQARGDARHVCYDLDGRPPSLECELTHLRGYRGAKPVRIGNAAAAQDQHDVFGEVIAAVYMCSEAMPSMRPLRPGLWKLVSGLANEAARHWSHADHGMWEVRDHPRHFLSSKVRCWSALELALAIAARDALDAPVSAWQVERDRIHEAVLTTGFDPDVGAFRRAFDEGGADASALLIPRYGMLPANDTRMVRTVQVVLDRLGAGDGLLRRYTAPDGLPGGEGAFIACSFWLVDCLTRQGHLNEARELFEAIAARASPLGLFSEQIDPASGELLGNYPQAFTHLALIRSAVGLAAAEGRDTPGRTRSAREGG